MDGSHVPDGAASSSRRPLGRRQLRSARDACATGPFPGDHRGEPVAGLGRPQGTQASPAVPRERGLQGSGTLLHVRGRGAGNECRH